MTLRPPKCTALRGYHVPPDGPAARMCPAHRRAALRGSASREAVGRHEALAALEPQRGTPLDNLRGEIEAFTSSPVETAKQHTRAIRLTLSAVRAVCPDAERISWQWCGDGDAPDTLGAPEIRCPHQNTDGPDKGLVAFYERHNDSEAGADVDFLDDVGLHMSISVLDKATLHFATLSHDPQGPTLSVDVDPSAVQPFVREKGCACAVNSDGSTTDFLCPLHADQDPCLAKSTVTGKRRKGTIARGKCTSCGWQGPQA